MQQGFWDTSHQNQTVYKEKHRLRSVLSGLLSLPVSNMQYEIRKYMREVCKRVCLSSTIFVRSDVEYIQQNSEEYL